jgi:cytochrome c2
MSATKTKSQSVIVIGCFLVAGTTLLFTACGLPASQSAPMLPTGTSALLHLTLSPIPTASQTDGTTAGSPEQAELPTSGDPLKGKQLFNAFQPAAGIACITCHRVDSEERLVGPGLLDVGHRVERRMPDMSTVEYLHQSIVNPSAYVVEGYADLMPKNWGNIFSEAQIDDLIAYLLTLAKDKKG